MESLSLLLGLGSKVIDKLFPDQESKAKAQLELMKLAQSGELKELELAVKDRDSARKREMALGGYTNPTIAFFILGGFFGVVSLLFFVPVEEGGVKEPLFMLLGSLGTMATQVVAYYFGSSSGSKHKTDKLTSINNHT